MRRFVATGLFVVVLAPAVAEAAIRCNRRWDVLPRTPPTGPAHRRALRAAARRFGDWAFDFSGVRIDRRLLEQVAASEHPVRRRLRERLAQAVDVRDFLFFLDDLLRAKRRGRIDDATVPSGRARLAGILLHPDDVFRNRPRIYGRRGLRLSVDEPPNSDVRFRPRAIPAGSIWTAAYPQPETEGGHLAALARARPKSDLVPRLAHLFAQLRMQGAHVDLNASVRSRERGYLIYGSYILSRDRTEREVRRSVRKLNRMRRRYGLRAPIRWLHPGGWRATVRAAREMAGAYGVVYATRWGAVNSDHYDGKAIDFAVTKLPPWLALTSYDGKMHRTFDLRAPAESRDLNLTPRLIRWVEQAYDLEKLESDYPHWVDAK